MLLGSGPLVSAVGASSTPPRSPTNSYRESFRQRLSDATRDLNDASNASKPDGANSPPKEESDSELSTLMASAEAYWARKKSQWMAHFASKDDDTESEKQQHTSETDSKCHVCNVSLRLYRLRHHCRNCRRAVCGVHSKNQMPLPHKGIMKEVRVCDICTKELVQRRAGYRSPRRSERFRGTSEDWSLLANASSDVDYATGGFSNRGDREHAGSTSDKPVAHASQGIECCSATAQSVETPFGLSCGVLYSCLLEEQANIMDELLYLGTFTMGGRAMASRHMNANVSLWKDRWFMLTSAEILCFKATPSSSSSSASATDEECKTSPKNAVAIPGASTPTDVPSSANHIGNPLGIEALGELRSSVHLTDILHIEVDDQYPRILTVIRSDGRVFRVRAKTPEQCQEIASALRGAQQRLQDAMHRLQRGVLPEDFTISCVTLQHESSLPERVVASSPQLLDRIRVEMYPSSILRFYVNGPDANGVAQVSCQTIFSTLTRPATSCNATINVDADPLSTSAVDTKALRVTLRPSPVSTQFRESREHKDRVFWGVLSALVAIGVYLNYQQQYLQEWLPLRGSGTALEVLVWLLSVILALTRFNDPLLLLITTRRVHRAKRFCVSCVGITYGRKSHVEAATSGSSATTGSALPPSAPGSSSMNGAVLAGEVDEDPEFNAEMAGILEGTRPFDPRFLEGCNGDVEEARQRYVATMKWRRSEMIDSILLRPHPHFAALKESYTHFTHKKDRQGHVVTYEHLGYMKKMRDDFLARGVTEAEAIRHQVMLQEFLWDVIDPRPFPDGTQIKIFDIKGISMGDVSGDVFQYMKAMGMTIAEYNPERIFQIFLVNPPSWFSLIWKLVAPLINPKTRERVHVLRGQKEIGKALLEFIDEDSLPVEYGGSCRCAGGCFTHSPEERDLREYVEGVLNVLPPGDPRIAQRLAELKDKYRRQLLPFQRTAPDAGAAKHQS
ncbi:hypothetical protein PINS_up005433 [Pythium insidiosum]|nr:hypothetical protein PINS_up005433 [Pythium insidiosum]